MCLSQVLVSYKYFHDTRKDNMLSFFLPPTYKNTKKKSNGEKENPYHHPHPHKNIPMNLYGKGWWWCYNLSPFYLSKNWYLC